MKILKKKVLLGAPAIALAFLSLQAFFGAVLGYFLAKFFAGYGTGSPGKIKSLAFNVGGWRVHLHHWLFGSMVLMPSLYYGFLPFDKFVWGMLGGLIFQGIYSYSDWYKVLMRRKRS